MYSMKLNWNFLRGWEGGSYNQFLLWERYGCLLELHLHLFEIMEN